MTKISYKRLLRARYNYLQKNGVSMLESSALDGVMVRPHPEREIAFVELDRFFKHRESPAFAVITLKGENKQEKSL